MKTVLLAESQGIVAMDIIQLLRQNNFQISATVSKAEDLIKQYKLCKPDLVVAHLHLEGKISGEEAIRQINSIDSTPIIIISSSTQQKLDNLFSSSPRCAVLAKPFDQKELLKMINEMTGS